MLDKPIREIILKDFVGCITQHRGMPRRLGPPGVLARHIHHLRLFGLRSLLTAEFPQQRSLKPQSSVENCLGEEHPPCLSVLFGPCLSGSRSMSQGDYDEDEYHLPLQDQRVFGAGIKRKRVPFVRAESEPTTSAVEPTKPGLGDRYLSIVLPQHDHSANEENNLDQDRSKGVVCTVCRFPTTSSLPTAGVKPTQVHGSSLVHQVCLSHSHPPSHLDRENVGLKYLSSYGWDPDSRRGLGPSGSGIRIPIKADVKNDTIGIGFLKSDPTRVHKESKTKPNKQRLSAKQVQNQIAAGRKREMQLNNAFYGKDLEAYLGSQG
jgi:G-patch domain